MRFLIVSPNKLIHADTQQLDCISNLSSTNKTDGFSNHDSCNIKQLLHAVWVHQPNPRSRQLYVGGGISEVKVQLTTPRRSQ